MQLRLRAHYDGGTQDNTTINRDLIHDFRNSDLLRPFSAIFATILGRALLQWQVVHYGVSSTIVEPETPKYDESPGIFF